MLNWFDKNIQQRARPQFFCESVGRMEDSTWLIFTIFFFGTCCTNDTHWFIWLNHEEVASDKHFERCYRFKKPQCISISHSQSHYITEQAIFFKLSYCSILPDLPSLLVSPSVIAHLLSEHWLYVGAGQLIAQEDKNWTELGEIIGKTENGGRKLWLFYDIRYSIFTLKEETHLQ